MSMSKEDMKEYWTEFLKVLDKMGGPILTKYKKLDRSSIGFQRFPAGEATAQLFSVIDIDHGRDPKNVRIRAEINLKGGDAKELYQFFEMKKDIIEGELGFELDWWKPPKKENSNHYRIAIHNKVNPENRMDWPRQHEWLIKHLCKMHPVVGKYVGKFRS